MNLLMLNKYILMLQLYFSVKTKSLNLISFDTGEDNVNIHEVLAKHKPREF